MKLAEDYKELKEGLKNQYTKSNTNSYSIIGALKDWMYQCGVKHPNKNKCDILCRIYGCVPYIYVEEVRLEILDYLKMYDGIGNNI